MPQTPSQLTCAPEEQDNDDPGQQPPVVAIPSQQSLPVPIAVDSIPPMREYNDAALYCCSQTHVSDTAKQRTLAIVDALGLRPFAIKASDGAEQNGLVHTSVIASAGQCQVAPNMPSPNKRKYTRDDTCLICTPTQAPGLDYVL